VTRTLIVNADDFGLSDGVNRGIARAHEHGVVTSASLMVRHEAAAAAAAYAREHRDLSVGLHVDLGEWVMRSGEWTAVYELEQTSDAVEAQLEAFRRLVGDDPTHLDSHQHVHRGEPAHRIVCGVAARLGVPLRDRSPSVRHLGAFYGADRNGRPALERVSVAALIELVRALPDGVTELGCHPGYADGLPSEYGEARAVEVETLADPRVRAALNAEGIQLRSFRDAFG
jgi:chitin disaccharide deacetylase